MKTPPRTPDSDPQPSPSHIAISPRRILARPKLPNIRYRVTRDLGNPNSLSGNGTVANLNIFTTPAHPSADLDNPTTPPPFLLAPNAEIPSPPRHPRRLYAPSSPSKLPHTTHPSVPTPRAKTCRNLFGNITIQDQEDLENRVRRRHRYQRERWHFDLSQAEGASPEKKPRWTQSEEERMAWTFAVTSERMDISPSKSPLRESNSARNGA